MEFARMLDKCRGLEDRAAALYRRFAAAARGNPEVCRLWTELAREEEAHARSIASLAGVLRPAETTHIQLDGWTEPLADVATQLAAAECLPPSAPLERQLVVALDLERSELEAARRALLEAAGIHVDVDRQTDHATRLAGAASRLSDNADVRLAAALLRARALLQDRTHAAAG